ncbi:hypothetical protein [Avibacterium paragallinarum]|uniref:hypothetical protein n=1 Tax=Avibacterium paragallinarum TaxID=728 RepID=UPI001FD71EBE|nr:hypothetical protein [Avibacterium paragallinarum]
MKVETQRDGRIAATSAFTSTVTTGETLSAVDLGSKILQPARAMMCYMAMGRITGWRVILVVIPFMRVMGMMF